VPLLLIACCGAGVVGFMISGNDAGTSPPPPPDRAVEEPVVSEGGDGVGDPVRDGKFEFVVAQVETGVEQVGDDVLTRTPQGR
jgi:hypothetical protein